MTPTRIPLRKPTRHERMQAWCDRHPVVVMLVLTAATAAVWWLLFWMAVERR